MMDRISILIVYDETYENSTRLMEFLKEDQCIESIVRVLAVKHDSSIFSLSENQQSERLSILKELMANVEMAQEPEDFNYVVFISSNEQRWSHLAEKSDGVHINWGLQKMENHTSCGERLRKRLREFFRLAKRVTI